MFIGAWASGGAARDAAAALVTEHRTLLAARLLLGPVPAVIIAWLIQRNLPRRATPTCAAS